MRLGKISVGFDRPLKPRYRFLPNAEVALRCARDSHPDACHRVARAEPKGLGNVSLGFFGAADEHLTYSNIGVRVGEISI